MIYAKPLPRIDRIMHLVEVAGPFPMARWEISEIAQRYGFDNYTLDFLELFPEEEVFESREDLAARTEELMILMLQERQMDEEGPLSSQD